MNGRLQIPALHFATPVGWLNDPNGLVFQDGYWHLFYQHHPHSLQWGPMHWGHARSKDLTTWEHLPIALYPNEAGAAFSGSAVIDHHNTAGLGSGAMVAMYTLAGDGTQFQGIAHSSDGGVTLTPSQSNPVLRSPEGIVDFRDPKVFPFNNELRMVLAVVVEVWIYGSPDLHGWTLLSAYRDDAGSEWGTWETPDLMKFVHPVSGDDVWVLTIGMESNAPAGASGMYYRTGTFDGVAFTPTDAHGHWADHGPDFYAAQSWSNTEPDRHVWIAWMNNWQYSQHSPQGISRGLMTLARDIGLKQVGDDLLLTQLPIIEQADIDHDHEVAEFGPGQHEIDAPVACMLSGVVGPNDTVSIEAAVDGDIARVHIDGRSRSIRLQRVGPSADAIEHFALDTTAIVPGDSSFDIYIILDIGTIEVFAANGTLTMSALTNKVQQIDTISFASTVPIEAVTLRQRAELGVMARSIPE